MNQNDGKQAEWTTKVNWISVEDRLPDRGMDVLVAWYSAHTNTWQYMVDGACPSGIFMSDGSPDDPPISYWMPLPEPPGGIMSDIIERLHAVKHYDTKSMYENADLCHEAANEIEILTCRVLEAEARSEAVFKVLLSTQQALDAYMIAYSSMRELAKARGPDWDKKGQDHE